MGGGSRVPGTEGMDDEIRGLGGDMCTDVAFGTSPSPLGLELPEPQDWHPPMRVPTWHAPMLPYYYTPAELDAAEEELKEFKKVFGPPLDKPGNAAYIEFSKKKGWQYHTEKYLADRDAFFGSCRSYAQQKAEARAELEADKRLKKTVGGAGAVKAGTAGEEAQVIFYAWTRKAYQNELGEGTDIPALIKSQTSERLKKALAQVRADYGKPFSAGGFNPRPIKKSGKYRLGTLSNHALGTAIDIDDAHNPQLESRQWGLIEKYTGKSIPKGTRISEWKTAPKQLHDRIREMSDEFVKRIADALKTPPGAAKAPTLEDVVGTDPHLKLLGLPFVKKWKDGFFTLPWALVKELHEENFVWGATFTTVDLHHFELP